MGEYRTIVADPPWQPLDKRNRTGISYTAPGTFNVKQLGYPTMTLAAIEDLPVSDLAHDDAHLLVWTTQYHLEFTFPLVRAWRFTPVCTLAWCKEPHGWGPGGTFQSTLEYVVYARRGKADSKRRVERQWWIWPRGRHSAKPEAFLDIVEATFPGPYLEMFARRDRLGWDTWGDESLGTVAV